MQDVANICIACKRGYWTFVGHNFLEVNAFLPVLFVIERTADPSRMTPTDTPQPVTTIINFDSCLSEQRPSTSASLVVVGQEETQAP